MAVELHFISESSNFLTCGLADTTKLFSHKKMGIISISQASYINILKRIILIVASGQSTLVDLYINK